jgi:hypothetical protein
MCNMFSTTGESTGYVGSECHHAHIDRGRDWRVNGPKPLAWWKTNIPSLVRFEVFTAVTMKNGVFWDVPACGSCKNRRFGISSQRTSVASCSLCCS